MTATTHTALHLATVRQFLERHPYMTHGGIRHLIFHAKTNDFTRCIKRIGRRIYIDETAFVAWLEAQSKNQ
jgi:hypothetical protein